jgi:hypothetical protein
VPARSTDSLIHDFQVKSDPLEHELRGVLSIGSSCHAGDIETKPPARCAMSGSIDLRILHRESAIRAVSPGKTWDITPITCTGSWRLNFEMFFYEIFAIGCPLTQGKSRHAIFTAIRDTERLTLPGSSK